VYIGGGILTVTNTGQVYGSGGYGVYANNGAAVTNFGSIGGAANGVIDINGSTVTNTSTGTISGGLVGVNASGGALTNAGSITGVKEGAVANGGSNITNASTGTIIGSQFGIETNGSSITNNGVINGPLAGIDAEGAEVTNSGTIHGSSYGISAEFGGTLTNTGLIYGGTGVYAFNSVTITNSGTIAGGTAVQLVKHSTLNVLAGAVFSGAVTDDGTGALNLAGTVAGTLDMGGSFSGFNNISLGSAAWTLEGTTGELANGQVITGFTLGDTGVVEGFAATYATYITGSGLLLGNAAGSYMINVATSLVNGEALVLSTDGTNSTLSAEIGTISTSVAHGVQTNNHTYAASLSIASTGTVNGASYGINAKASTLTTGGTIAGGTYAVETSKGSTLNVLAGAMFEGAVADDGTGVLNLAGTMAGTLNMGGSFTGFHTIAFGSADWTLEGTASELANGQTISGFALGDTIGLQGFAATAATYIAGTGLTLSNATGSETINIGTAAGAVDAFVLNHDASNTTLTLFAEITTISTYVPHGVSLNNGTYAASLSITSTGTVNGASYGVNAKAGTVTTSGTVAGGTSALETSDGSTVNVLAGAVFQGGVADDGTGVLNLAGTIAGVLDMGGSFTGFNTIAFGSADWTLEGTASELANGETISGFAPGDTIGLQGFAATAATYSAGTGLIFSNATGSETINLGTAAGAADVFVLTQDASNTTLTLFAKIATISTYVPHAVKTNNGSYATSLSITSTGTVSGGFYGIDIISSTVTNSGSILGYTAADANAGILTNNGTLTGSFEGAGAVNASAVINTGSISGSVFGVYLKASTLTNSGTIASSNYAVRTAYASTLNVLAGGVFEGTVQDDHTGLLLLGGTTAGALNMGGSFSGFEHISFGSASWTLEGTAAELANGETITGFAVGDTLALDGFIATSETYVPGTGLELGDGTSEVTLGITGPPFSYSATAQGTDITALCYLRGTNILTPRGEVPVECLTIGDRVVTRYNGLQKIKFLGRQSYAANFLAKNRAKWPVRISAGALGEDLPTRDLFVSPGHSLLVGQTLILAENLVNGLTITQTEPTETIDYIQIELDSHDCVLAEGTWSETFADGPGLRAQFHNAAAFWALYPHHQTPATLTLCAPRPLAGPELEAALLPLITQATKHLTPGPLEGSIDKRTPTRIEGWAMDTAHPDLPIQLSILLRGETLATILACDPRPDLVTAGKGHGNHAFALDISPPLSPTERATLRILRTADQAPLGLNKQKQAAPFL
jgi:hypothetical protein